MILQKSTFYYFFSVALIGCLLMVSIPSVMAQSKKDGMPTVKVPRKKKKVKRVKPNKRGKRVKKQYERPASVNTDTEHEKKYVPPRSVTQSSNPKDNYKRPKTVTNSGKVKVSEGKSFNEPGAEEGNKRPHLPLLDRVFNPYNRYARQKERYLENLSINLRNYQGETAVRKRTTQEPRHTGKRKVQASKRRGRKARYYEASQEHSGFAGRYKVPSFFIQEKVKKNQAYYISRHTGYRGPTQRAQTRFHKKQSEMVHQYNGNIRIKRGKLKDRHPSVDYLAGKGRKSYEQKERHRRRRVWLSHIFKSKDQPQHLKEKTRKPRYDKKESDIWYY